MMKIINWNPLTNTEKERLLQRSSSSRDLTIKNKVQAIIRSVRLKGDAKLKELTTQFDKVELNRFQISQKEINKAFTKISKEANQAILFAKKQIETYHQAIIPKTIKIFMRQGIVCEKQVRAIERVGLYIPGGSAPLVSTVLMLAIPSQLAECPIRILCSPPNQLGEIDPHILVAATLCGIKKIYKIGGAQAIAAMAYGTETIPKVDKLFGPGNKWVTTAKCLVSQDPLGASIDLPAGPSELAIIADRNANANYIAADLLSQAEHDRDSQVLLITHSIELALQVKKEIHRQLVDLPRKSIAESALKESRIIIADTIKQAIHISNIYAPEHLILHVDRATTYISQIKNAGAVFVGPWAPETLGDYVTGSNHVLPTDGYAKSISGLSVYDFMKCINVQYISKIGLKQLNPVAIQLAEIEGLEAHKRALLIREV